MVGSSGAVTWDEFMGSINHSRKKVLVASLALDPKLAMIHGLSQQWRTEWTNANTAARIRRARAPRPKTLELDTTALRPYSHPDVAARMPKPRAHTWTARERRQRRDAARRYWLALAAGRYHGMSLQKLAERTRGRMSATSWEAVHAPVERTPDALLRTFINLHRHRSRRPLGADPKPVVAMSPERALAIAIRVLEKQAG
ncbi:hypothetical protein [Schumannella soli]|uniref:Uncharacterized protein n=1 Tax=Schumannella soli TaxID=2590779 RepID=A0A506Y982_9MICO|nr:hypothetical protein [Schumannella soli]TPW78050.1 hypothetical protein FJ657_05335 [Schumannella soli]